MPYFPPTQADQPYVCEGCGGTFIRSSISCCMAHAPGTCCHHFERPVIDGVQMLYARALKIMAARATEEDKLDRLREMCDQ